MLAMQWCQTNRLTGQLPRWFLTYCASVLQLFADDTSSLRSTVNTFQDWAFEDALREYDEPVDWAMTEGGPLPTVSSSDMEAAIRNPPSNSASGPSSTSKAPQPPHPSTRRKSGTSKGTTGANHKPHRHRPLLQEKFQSQKRQKCLHVPELVSHHPTNRTVNHIPRVDTRPTKVVANIPQRSGHPTPSPGQVPRRVDQRTTSSQILDARDPLRAVLPNQQAKSRQQKNNGKKKLR